MNTFCFFCDGRVSDYPLHHCPLTGGLETLYVDRTDAMKDLEIPVTHSAEETFTVEPDPDMFYVVAMTPEHAPFQKPTLATLCEGHYLQACTCLMIRKVLAVRSREIDLDGVTELVECKFCS